MHNTLEHEHSSFLFLPLSLSLASHNHSSLNFIKIFTENVHTLKSCSICNEVFFIYSERYIIYFEPSSYQIALTLAYISHIQLHRIFNVLTLDMLFFWECMKTRKLDFFLLNKRHMCETYEEKQFVIHPVTTATVDSTLLCGNEDSIGEKRLTDENFFIF